MVENKEIALVLKTLYDNLVNEVETQNTNSFKNPDTVKLYECFLNALYDTQGQYCTDSDTDLRIPRPVVNPSALLEDAKKNS